MFSKISCIFARFFSVMFTPNKAGEMEVEAKYGGEDIPGTPKKVRVLPDIDTSSVKTYGPGVEKDGMCCRTLMFFFFILDTVVSLSSNL